MNRQERTALDRHITGNYGEDQLADQQDSMPPEFDEMTIAEEQAAADEQWRQHLKREGISEEEALEQAIQWCDSQD